MIYNSNDIIMGSSIKKIEEKSLSGIKYRKALETIKQNNGNALELGSGAGRLASFIRTEKINIFYTGIDINLKSLIIAKNNTDNKQTKWINSGLEKYIPVKDESIDTVILIDILEHLDDMDKVFSELRRISKKHAGIFIYVPCEGEILSIYSVFSILRGWKRRYAGHIQKFRKADVMEILNKHRFKVEKIEYSYHFIGQIYDFFDYFQFLLKERNIKIPLIYKKILNIISKLSYYENKLLKKIYLGSTALCISGKKE